MLWPARYILLTFPFYLHPTPVAESTVVLQRSFYLSLVIEPLEFPPTTWLQRWRYFPSPLKLGVATGTSLETTCKTSDHVLEDGGAFPACSFPMSRRCWLGSEDYKSPRSPCWESQNNAASLRPLASELVCATKGNFQITYAAVLNDLFFCYQINSTQPQILVNQVSL